MDDSFTDSETVSDGQMSDIAGALCGLGGLPKYVLASCRKAGKTFVAGK